MASRTNKQGIFKKKQQLEKLKLLKKGGKRYLKNKNLSEDEKISKGLIFDLVNPKGNKYTRDKSGRKIICKNTGLREDLDGYRLIFKANTSELTYVFKGIIPRLRKLINKNKKK